MNPKARRFTSKNEQPCSNTNMLSEIGASFINGSLIKPFEESAARKGLIGELREYDFYPLWFHYENERNVQIWKRGRSLAELHYCRFWVNPFTLIEKIRLKNTIESGPFSTPSYFEEKSLFDSIKDDTQAESERYFTTLTVLLEQAVPHLHALSLVSAEVIEDDLEEVIFT